MTRGSKSFSLSQVVGALYTRMSFLVPILTHQSIAYEQGVLQHSAQDLHLHEGGGPEDELEISCAKEGGISGSGRRRRLRRRHKRVVWWFALGGKLRPRFYYCYCYC